MRTFILILGLIFTLGACSSSVLPKPVTLPIPPPKCELQAGNYLMKTFLMKYSPTCPMKPPPIEDKIIPFPSGQICGVFGVPLKGGVLIVKLLSKNIVSTLVIGDNKCTVEYGIVGELIE